jgi:RNA polymerase sigma-70 factor (ECF subfamily)
MATINLRDYYPWYTQDTFLEVSDEVAAELAADVRYEKAYVRREYRHMAHYSLDAEDGIETEAVVCFSDCPERGFDLIERHCQLCYALNSLPEAQGRRIDAHFLLGMSQQEIASAEGVTKGTISRAITRGLEAMKNYLKLLLLLM